MGDGAVSVKQQLADLARLKAATQRRHGFRPGTPEWVEAVKVEDGLIDRIRHWVRPARADLTGR